MDAVLLTWRPQNILSIWLMIILLFLVVTLATQAHMRYEGKKAASNG